MEVFGLASQSPGNSVLLNLLHESCPLMLGSKSSHPPLAITDQHHGGNRFYASIARRYIRYLSTSQADTQQRDLVRIHFGSGLQVGDRVAGVIDLQVWNY